MTGRIVAAQIMVGVLTILAWNAPEAVRSDIVMVTCTVLLMGVIGMATEYIAERLP
jgi:hypothetical protein